MYVVLVEGNAEKAIIDILLDNNKLIFQRSEILEDEIIKSRNAKTFCNEYLNFNFDGKIIIYRVLDSKNEKFKVPKEYEFKVEKVINIITRPEIEILIIIAENLYDKYKKSKQRPSIFLKHHLKGFAKSCDYYCTYFNDPNKLISAINKYSSITKFEKNEQGLIHILRK